MHFGSLALQGREVLLRPLEPADASALAAAAAESREHYDYNPVPNGYAGAQQYIEVALEARTRGQRYPFAILWNARVVGSTSYSQFQPWTWPAGCDQQRLDRPDAVEVGYTWLAASAQRTRCNTEAKYLLLRHAFETWCVHRVAIRTDERNQRSRRAIERLGAKLDGILRADKPAMDCSVRNSAYYSIVTAEWPEVKARLDGWLRSPT
jgi:RimJ/RimL family protein N-acetyltransferase